MSLCLFAADLHGDPQRYAKLTAAVARMRPAALFLGGDLLPPAMHGPIPGIGPAADFLHGYLRPRLERLRRELDDRYPRIFVILGNDDPRFQEAGVWHLAAAGLWEYVHQRHVGFGAHRVYGYACVPPTPFMNKDWERYDVSRFVDPGCVSPEDGRRSVPVAPREARYRTIAADLRRLAGDAPQDRAIWLFHTPPYATRLDRAALDGARVDHVPLDPHVGSIAVRRFIERHQPWITLHGHVHEAARLTGTWRDTLGRTQMMSAAHDGPELALVRFRPEDPQHARRLLL